MNKNVLVTGGSGGIGGKIVEELIKTEYSPIVLDVVKTSNQHVKFWKSDVTNVSELQDLKKDLPEDFTIDHIVCVAGRSLLDDRKPFIEQDIEQIHKSIDLNLVGHLNVLHTFLPILKKSSEPDKTITIISSINALRNYICPTYSSAKAGIYGLIKPLCAELGQDGIRVNAISPGTVVTQLTLSEPKNWEKLLNGTALNRFATTDDIAKTVKFLIENPGITGQNIVVDAGQTSV